VDETARIHHDDHVGDLTRQWAQERPELDTRYLAVVARVMRLERFCTFTAQEALGRFGVNEGEANVLAALRRSGPPYALTPSDLVRSLLLSSGAMTNRIDRLEEAGLVTRSQDPDDRRRVLVELTEQGREVIDAAMGHHIGALETLLADALPERDRAELERLLAGVLAHVESAAEPVDP
jgi:DNA-binding MarR family transcriptional regulator